MDTEVNSRSVNRNSSLQFNLFIFMHTNVSLLILILPPLFVIIIIVYHN